MKFLYCEIFFALGALWPQSPVQAQAQELALDGKIDLGSNTSFKWRVGDRLEEGFSFDEVTTRKLIAYLLSNHRLEPAEVDALKELSRTDVETVKFTVNSIGTTVPVADAEGRRIIGLVLKPVNMEALWGGGLEGKKELAELHGLSIAHKNSIEKFVASKLHPVWKKSNINNAYEPIRKVLGEAHSAHKAGMKPKDHANACDMYHDGAGYLDKYLRDTIPDYMYNWLEAPKHTRTSD